MSCRSPTHGRSPLCDGSGVFACRAQHGVAPRSPPGSWVFMAAAAHHHGIAAAGSNRLPFSQPLQPRGCPRRASALCQPPLAPRPPRRLLEGLRDGAGAVFAPQQPQCHPLGLVWLGHRVGGGAGCPHPAAGDGHPSVLDHSPEQVGWERGVSAPHFWPQWHCGVWSQDQDPQQWGQTPQIAATPLVWAQQPLTPAQAPCEGSRGLPCQAGAPPAPLSPGTSASGCRGTPWRAVPGNCRDLRRVAVPEPRSDTRLSSVWVDGISGSARGTASGCQAR